MGRMSRCLLERTNANNALKWATLFGTMLLVTMTCPAVQAGFVYDGTGSPETVGFTNNTNPPPGWLLDNPAPGLLHQIDTVPSSHWRHLNDVPGLTNLELDNNAPNGWAVETRFQLRANSSPSGANDVDDGFAAGVFLRNLTGTFAVNFLSDGQMRVWDGAGMVNVNPTSYGGVDNMYHTVRIRAPGGGSPDVELIVNGDSQGTFTMQGGQDLFLSFGDHSGNKMGQGDVVWDYVVNTPEPTTSVLAVMALLVGVVARRRTTS